MKGFINEFKISEDTLNTFKVDVLPQCKSLNNINGFAKEIKGIMVKNEKENLLEELNTQIWIPVGIDGILNNYTEGDEIGSYRLSFYEKELADILYERISPFLETDREYNDSVYTDWDGHSKWEPIGINPLFRCIRYTDKGLLVPHYDGSYVESDDVRSLTTVVLYLEGNKICGATRFLKEEQLEKPLNDWNRSDWTRLATEEEITNKIYGEPGDAVLFDHWILHDSEPMLEGRKTIIRTDVMYKKVKK